MTILGVQNWWGDKSSKMVKKYAVLLVVVVILSFFVILFAFRIIPLSDLVDKPSFDIHEEIEILNEGRTNKFTVVEADWLEFRQGLDGADRALYERQNSWDDFKDSLELKFPKMNFLSLDENNRVIWYGMLPTIYFEY